MNISDFIQRRIVDNLPVSFTLDGQQAIDKFGCLEQKEKGEGKVRYERILTTDRLKATLNVVCFELRGAVEWWLDFEATGQYDSELIDDLNFCDLGITGVRMNQDICTRFPCLHWAKGSRAAENDFTMQLESFWPFRNDATVYSCDFGRSSSGVMPYFNLQTSENSGLILAIGWSGQWNLSVQRTNTQDTTTIEFKGFMDRARFRVQKGEKLSLPHMVALPWEGVDIEYSYNLFRAFMLDEAPKVNGERITAPVRISSWGGMSAEKHKKIIKIAEESGVGAEVFWVDAGWHGAGDEKSDNDYQDTWFYNVGWWEPLKHLYPNGMEEVGKCAQDANMRFLLWFEFERVVSRLKIVDEHREYFIGPKLPFYPEPPYEGARTPYSLMLNLGNDDARKYITDVISQFITNCHMSFFRIDFNYEPLQYWRYNDSQDRWGITEIKYVNGLYKMLDELKKKFPFLAIDNCAGGGRRLDFMFFRRAIPLFSTDYYCAPDRKNAAVQLQNYNLSRWLPIHGAEAHMAGGSYDFRSHFAPSIGANWAVDEEVVRKNASWYKAMFDQVKKARDILIKDIYPLSEMDASERSWFAYEAYDADVGKGLVLALRRRESENETQVYSIKGVDKNKQYQLENADGGSKLLSGEELINGLEISIPHKEGSALIFFSQV